MKIAISHCSAACAACGSSAPRAVARRPRRRARSRDQQAGRRQRHGRLRATSGSRPMMMNSVVPMAKALIASASNGMGMSFSGRRRTRRRAVPHRTKGRMCALSRRCRYLIIGAFEPFSNISGKSHGSTGRYPAVRRGGRTGQPVRRRAQAEPHAGRRERAPREARGGGRHPAVRPFDPAVAAHRRGAPVPERLPAGIAGARRRERAVAGRPQRRRRPGGCRRRPISAAAGCSTGSTNSPRATRT